MKKLDEIKRILVEHKHELHEQHHVQGIGIFGSYVRGDQTSKSEVDILVEFDAPNGWEIVDLHDDLEKLPSGTIPRCLKTGK